MRLCIQLYALVCVFLLWFACGLWHHQLLMLSAFRRSVIALGGAAVSLARAPCSLLCICYCCCTFFTRSVINFHYQILLCSKLQPLRFAVVIVNICCGCLTVGFDVSFSAYSFSFWFAYFCGFYTCHKCTLLINITLCCYWLVGLSFTLHLER